MHPYISLVTMAYLNTTDEQLLAIKEALTEGQDYKMDDVYNAIEIEDMTPAIARAIAKAYNEHRQQNIPELTDNDVWNTAMKADYFMVI